MDCVTPLQEQNQSWSVGEEIVENLWYLRESETIDVAASERNRGRSRGAEAGEK